MMKKGKRVFLSAKWLNLAMLSWQIDPELLAPYVPRGTELDYYEGKTFISLVGFLFEETRVLGIPIPWHSNFQEVNLRFYLRRRIGSETRRGVAFISEMVPRWTIASVARLVYNEPYVACAMQHAIAPDLSQVAYRWKDEKQWLGFSMQCSSNKTELKESSLEEFISEHYYGYGTLGDGSTIEYRVKHPRWKVYATTSVQVDSAIAAFYPRAFATTLLLPPANAFLADGSSVSVYKATKIA